MSLCLAAAALSLTLTSCGGGTTQTPLLMPMQLVKLPRINSFVPFFAFGGKADTLGSGGYGGLTIESNGTIYGAATFGGDLKCSGLGHVSFNLPGCGLIYALSPGATGAGYSETVLHVFKSGADGNSPNSTLLQIGSDLYGTTAIGGANCQYPNGCGTVFKLSTAGATTILYRFNGVDGYTPVGGVVADSHGNLFGTTTYGGGAAACPYFAGCGTAYELVRKGSSYTYKVLYRFQGTTDGSGPGSGLLLENGTLFGTTLASGGSGSGAPNCYSAACGTAFALVPNGKQYRFVLLHAFAGGRDGNIPTGLVAGPNGTFYGTTAYGGGGNCGALTRDGGCGVIFVLFQAKSGKYFERILHRFGTYSEGLSPSSLTFYRGKLYGIANDGGINRPYCLTPPPNRVQGGCGTIYSLDKSGSNFQVLYRFEGNTTGNWPLAPPVISNGTLYGTTLLGGKDAGGIAYKTTIAP